MMREINQEELENITGAGPGGTGPNIPKDTTGPYDPLGAEKSLNN